MTQHVLIPRHLMDRLLMQSAALVRFCTGRMTATENELRRHLGAGGHAQYGEMLTNDLAATLAAIKTEVGDIQ